ncbi:MAG: DUF881 domain-containing protein [Firmicutes bacterium]|nr:DUF881 domain-containing protein [Bacillota bacterium]
MNGRLGYFSIILVSVVMGLMLALQFKVTNTADSSATRQNEVLALELKQIRQDRDDLSYENHDLRLKLDNALRGQTSANDALLEELTKARASAGLLPAKGPGVIVTLNDSLKTLQVGEDPNQYLIHDKDLLTVVNELRGAGAEAISINGQRLMANSEIRCAGTTILVNVTKIAPPFVITAVGDPDLMESSLKIKGGIVEYLEIWGIQVKIDKFKDGKVVQVPGYNGTISFKYAEPIKEGH